MGEQGEAMSDRLDHERSMGTRFASVQGRSMGIGGRIPPLLEDDAPLGRKKEDEILINHQT